MIIKDKTNPNIERHKQRLGLTGDVYIVNDLFIESLESHKVLIPTSTATTIEEAEQERIQYEQMKEEERKQLAEESREDQLEEFN